MQPGGLHSFPVLFLSLAIVLFCPLDPLKSDVSKGKGNWTSLEDREKIWEAVAGGKDYSVSPNKLEATFEKDGAEWTIVGANAPIVRPTVYPKSWPVRGNGFDVLVVPQPITNYKILPFTVKIENAIRSDRVGITAAGDSYEPASLVIRSGDADLKDVTVEVTDLKAPVKDGQGRTVTAVIPKDDIDIRVVKCWYQAGVALGDTQHKTLTPELLLHDDDLVRVDYDRQVDILKNRERLKDSASLKPFTVPGHRNKQIWFTAHIRKGVPPGNYRGSILIRCGDRPARKIGFDITVLGFDLPKPMLDYAMYYEGRLSGSSVPRLRAGLKTAKQMRAELTDMREHGLSNATVWHRVNRDESKWDEDWKRLQSTLDIRKEIGWGDRPLLYLDWKVSFRDDPEAFRRKTKKILQIAERNGIHDVYIYGFDEQAGKVLSALDDFYRQVQGMGAKVFVAGQIGQLLKYAGSAVDLYVAAGPIVKRPSNDPYKGVSPGEIMKARNAGRKVYIYANPQAGLEEPETYRRNYGFKLAESHADGTLDYAYQTGNPWNDFDNPGLRYHVMAYPTIDKPVPTIQWAGWREGVNDVRYLTLLMKRKKPADNFIEEHCRASSYDCRRKLISILEEGKGQRWKKNRVLH